MAFGCANATQNHRIVEWKGGAVLDTAVKNIDSKGTGIPMRSILIAITFDILHP